MKRNSIHSVVKTPVVVTMLTISLLTAACHEVYTPRPRSYFRIDFPEKTYIPYQSMCNYGFDYPVYAEINPYKGPDAEPCWINMEFPGYKGILHLTYKTLHDDLATHVEDIRLLAYKHIVKADDILEKPVSFPEREVYGLIYDIQGNTASSLSFYLTDSTHNFLSGSLYFSVRPNKDSLAPVIRFFSEDIYHLIKTLTWSK